MPIALTRAVSSRLDACQLVFHRRDRINVARAREQHANYEHMLTSLGCQVVTLPGEDDLPDCVFVEDIAVVLPELAVLTMPGAPARRGERGAIRDALSLHRPIVEITHPGTIDGGDVLVVGRRIYVGVSRRTNDQGHAQLAAAVHPHGYEVVAVPVRGALHLKSACTLVGPDRLLINPAWVDRNFFGALEHIDVAPSEPSAANALLVGTTVVYPEGFPETEARLRDRGVVVVPLPYSELQKAEGGVTCCSLIFAERLPSPGRG